MIRIGINTLALVPNRSGGDATYTRYLVEHLAKIDHHNRYYLFVAPYNREWFDIRQPNFRQVLCPLPNNFSLRALYEHSGLWLSANQMPLDVFHGPVNITPFFLRHPSMITIHDAVYRRKDQHIPLPLSLYWRVVRPRSVKRAERIIVVSETNRQELIAMGAVPPERVSVVYNGVHERFRPLDSAASRAWASSEHGLNQPFVLWVGRPYANKNPVRMIEAFATFNKRNENRYVLALAGPTGWEDPALREAVARTNVGPHLRQLGYIDNTQLPRLYNAAEALLFPSLHESFGIPIVEAMACGTPVVTSNVSGIPEITGDAAQLVDPLNIQAIADGLEAVLCHRERWQELRTRGLVRAQRFSWPENAARTIAIYQSIASAAHASMPAEKR